MQEGNGAGDGIRTRDINLGKVALYQLSYSRRVEAVRLGDSLILANGLPLRNCFGNGVT
jgi:hypothetical protein